MTPYYRCLVTEAEYCLTRNEAAILIGQDPGEGTPEAERLRLLALLLEDYEQRNFTPPSVSPLEAIRFRMEQGGLRQRDLTPYIGQRSHVSEVLAGKRPLSLAMIQRLHAGLGIPLASLFRLPTPAKDPTAEEKNDA